MADIIDYSNPLLDNNLADGFLQKFGLTVDYSGSNHVPTIFGNKITELR